MKAYWYNVTFSLTIVKEKRTKGTWNFVVKSLGALWTSGAPGLCPPSLYGCYATDYIYWAAWDRQNLWPQCHGLLPLSGLSGSWTRIFVCISDTTQRSWISFVPEKRLRNLEFIISMTVTNIILMRSRILDHKYAIRMNCSWYTWIQVTYTERCLKANRLLEVASINTQTVSIGQLEIFTSI